MFEPHCFVSDGFFRREPISAVTRGVRVGMATQQHQQAGKAPERLRWAGEKGDKFTI